MNSVKKILINSVLGILLIAAIAIHIAFLCWEREGFAVGSEWVIYIVLVIAFGWRLIDCDD